MFEMPLRLDDQIPRYSVGELFYDTEDLWLTVYDREVKGRVRFTGSGKARFRRYVDRRHTEDIPKHATPTLWRPVDPRTWPYELPEAARLVSEVVSTPPSHSPQIPPLHLGNGDFWPHPHIRLGRPGEKPESADESEARYLRAVRTHWMLTKERQIVECLWAKPLLVKSQVVEKVLLAAEKAKASDKEKLLKWLGFRPGDENDFHIDTSELKARPVPFKPTPRDISEWELGRWIEWRPTTDAGLIESQAHNPPPSFYELADTLSTTVSAIARRYESAKEELHRRATR